MKKLLVLVILSIGVTATALADNIAVVLPVKGPIGPANADFIDKGFTFAKKNNAAFIILQIDTPGGLSTAMRHIIQTILDSPIPVVSFVAPAGAHAASAGTYIVYASHLAAMAPATNLGAASPVLLNTPITPQDNMPPSTSDKKALNDATAYIKSLAQLHGRNSQWAIESVIAASSLSAIDALAYGVIDFIAPDEKSLLKQLHHRTVIIHGKEVVIDTHNILLKNYEPDWRFQLLNLLTDPSVAYVIMLIGVYGIIFELMAPGFILPGVLGSICLLLAGYALYLLPVNYTGLGLLFLGIVFMIAECLFSGFGVLGFGGLIAFFLGSVFLMDTASPQFSLPWLVIVTMSLLSAAFFVAVMSMVIRLRRRDVMSGWESLMNKTAYVEEEFAHEGRVRIGAESWQATSITPVRKGQPVKIVAVKGLVVNVVPLTGDD